jgi:hypothetical protein
MMLQWWKEQIKAIYQPACCISSPNFVLKYVGVHISVTYLGHCIRVSVVLQWCSIYETVALQWFNSYSCWWSARQTKRARANAHTMINTKIWNRAWMSIITYQSITKRCGWIRRRTHERTHKQTNIYRLTHMMNTYLHNFTSPSCWWSARRRKRMLLLCECSVSYISTSRACRPIRIKWFVRFVFSILPAPVIGEVRDE